MQEWYILGAGEGVCKERCPQFRVSSVIERGFHCIFQENLVEKIVEFGAEFDSGGASSDHHKMQELSPLLWLCAVLCGQLKVDHDLVPDPPRIRYLLWSVAHVLYDLYNAPHRVYNPLKAF